ncbi:MAG: peptide chain release factor 2 [Spirochaetes bacterium GWF1_41_5]|nr:MAG: peptide chain release factor 2 [Spirochaetes bacterium GWF1_41_5]
MQENLEVIKIDEKQERLRELEALQQSPDSWQNQGKLTEINKEQKKIAGQLKPWLKIRNTIADIKTLYEMSVEEKDFSQEKEIRDTLSKTNQEFEKLELVNLFRDETDFNNTFLNIHPGAGGTESCDWAVILYRMYIRWIERRGFDYEVLNFEAGEEAGLKSAALLVKGDYAHGFLKSETGVHRLVRISPFDANKRRHTSFCSVYCMPEIDDSIEVDINPSDLRIDTYRSSGAGGQHVNKTDSAVRITHLPTNIVVACQTERSQHQNKENAFKMLRARLYEHYKAEHDAMVKSKAAEKKKIEWGSQIRSYVFQPYTMVKDHRTNCEIGNIQDVMDGNIDQLIMEYLKKFRK